MSGDLRLMALRETGTPAPTSRLIDKRGRNAKIINWSSELTADCPKKIARNRNDPCAAKCPQLSYSSLQKRAALH